MPVALHNDTIGEATADIKVTLSENPLVYELGSTTEGVMTIWDDDAPELKVSALTPAITEAESISATFTISAEVSPNKNVMVRYNLTESSNFIEIEGTDKTAELNFTNQAKEDSITIAISSDTETESNGTITVTLTADTADPIKYTVAPAPDNSAEINVIDDDSLPVILISADSGNAAENIGTASFNLTATGLTETTSLMINATPTEDGHDFLTNAIAGTAADFEVQFSDPDGDNTYTGELSVTLDNDSTGEVTGDIKVTLNADPDSGATYRLGSDTEGVITIYDDDAPELEITAGDPVAEAEGATADFEISVEASPNRMVTVRYTLAESQNFIANEGPNKTGSLDFTNGATEATLPIAITNDSDIEANGTVTVTLTADTQDPATYYVASSPDNSAIINIIDDESLPLISILAASGEAIENSSFARFKLSATGITDSPASREVIIQATPSENGADFLTDNIADSPSQAFVNFTDPDGDNIYEGVYTVALHNDQIREASGEIKLTLNTSPTKYRLGAITEGIITVLDDDAPELKITASDPVAEAENATADFVISTEISLNKTITVRYELAESHDFIEDEGTDKTEDLDYSNGAKTHTLSIPILSDNDAETHGYRHGDLNSRQCRPDNLYCCLLTG